MGDFSDVPFATDGFTNKGMIFVLEIIVVSVTECNRVKPRNMG